MTSRERIFDIIRKSKWFCESRVPTHNDITETAAALDAHLQAEVKQLREALKEMTRYAKHWKGCCSDMAGRPHNPDENCICGITKAKAALEETK